MCLQLFLRANKHTILFRQLCIVTSHKDKKGTKLMGKKLTFLDECFACLAWPTFSSSSPSSLLSCQNNKSFIKDGALDSSHPMADGNFSTLCILQSVLPFSSSTQTWDIKNFRTSSSLAIPETTHLRRRVTNKLCDDVS
jgi:hypothetical protein